MVGQPNDLKDLSERSPGLEAWREFERELLARSPHGRRLVWLRTHPLHADGGHGHASGAPIRDPHDGEPYTQALEPYGGQVNTYRNSLGLHNVVQLLSTSPLVKKLPARKNELLHAFFRDDSLARRQGEPITTWLVRYEEALGKRKTVGIDLVALLPDIAGWQALNLAGLSEDRLERVVMKLPDDSYVPSRGYSGGATSRVCDNPHL